ncbi:hypothetical protein Ndes2526B_g02810 [Nannochloris sp. 'desiccata']|nr:putative Abnormal spindle-like microcephaly-associated protein [Chlorella desiccata (nom. nud.)]
MRNSGSPCASEGAPLEIKIPQEEIQLLECKFSRVQVGEAKVVPLNLTNHSSDTQELRIAQSLRSAAAELILLTHGQNVDSITISPDSTLQAGLRLHLPKEGRIAETLVLETQQGLQIRLTVTAIGTLDGLPALKRSSTKLRAFGKAQRVLVQANDTTQICSPSFLDDVAATTTSSIYQAAPQLPPQQQQQRSRTLASKPAASSDTTTGNRPVTIITHRRVAQAPGSMDLSSPDPQQNNCSHRSHPPTLNMNLNNYIQERDLVSSMDRQEAALCLWLNNMISGEHVVMEEEGKLEAATTSSSSSSSSSSRAASRLAARMRSRLWEIYSQDIELRDGMLRVEQRIDSGQLKAKTAEAALGAVQESASVRKALAAFHPLWLQLAAEIAVGRPSKAMSLDSFIKGHVLADKALLIQHKGFHTAAYWSQLGALVTKRMLLIIALLDRAGIKNGSTTSYPLLFKSGCGISNSADALQAAVGSLLGEVEVGRRLGRLGFKVSYAQTPRQEINFKVRNIAIDMRDGLRLCRLVDEAVGDQSKGVFQSARFPAVRRPDRLYNIELALKALKNEGMDTAGTFCTQNLAAGSASLAAAIVNGDRSATLCLLWRLVLQHYLPRLANFAELNIEIDQLDLKTPQLDSITIDSELAADAGRSGGNVAVLLRWMSAVTSKYGLHVSNFGRDIVDGSAFCVLIHHYLGAAHMPLASIFKSSTSIAQQGTTADIEQGIRSNFAALQTAVETLHVPMIVTADDFLSVGGADHRAVTLFTATLCHRLIESNREHRAAMVIQRRWRQRGSYRPGTARQHLHSWIAASSVIQRSVRVWLLHRGLNQFVQDKRRLEIAVTKLQAAWRGRSYREEYLASRAAVITIQTAWRGVMARREVFNTKLMPQIAAAGFQKRAKLIAVNQVWSEQRAAIRIQAVWRGSVQRRQFLAHLKENTAAVCIQKCVRGMLARKAAAIRRQHLAALREQAVEQTKRRMAELAKVMAQYAVRTAAAKRIQAAWRGYCCRVHYQALLDEKAEMKEKKAQRRADAGALIASWGPTFRDRLWFMKARRAALVLQAAWRRKLAQQNAAAIVIQKNIRAYLAVRQLAVSKTAALKIQSVYRGYVVRAGHPEAESLHGIRTRLRAAGARSGRASQHTIGSRTAAALEALSSSRSRALPSFAVLKDLARCTEASLTSCTMVVERGALTTLLCGAVASGRDKTLGEALNWALQCIANVCSCRSLVNNLFYKSLENGGISQLVDLLQQLREREEPFMATVAILEGFTNEAKRGSALKEQKPELVARLEGVARLLNHKRAGAATYLTKLEAQKGSDVSARQATRGLVSVTKQLMALGKVLENVGAQDLNELLAVGTTVGGSGSIVAGVGNRRASGVVVPLMRGKNTIVRAALAEISNKR